MAFKEKIFRLFGPYEKKIDTNKDVNGKGTLERYMEAYGDDIDTNIIPLLENLTQNLIDPNLSFARFLDYHEESRGVLMLDFSRNVASSQSYNEWMRRRILKHIEKFQNIKGTRKVYDVLFRLLVPTITSITILEYYTESRYDVIRYDDGAKYDSSLCSECTQYSIEIITSPTSVPSSDIVKAISNIVAFNNPTNTKVKFIKFNDTNIPIQ